MKKGKIGVPKKRVEELIQKVVCFGDFLTLEDKAEILRLYRDFIVLVIADGEIEIREFEEKVAFVHSIWDEVNALREETGTSTLRESLWKRLYAVYIAPLRDALFPEEMGSRRKMKSKFGKVNYQPQKKTDERDGNYDGANLKTSFAKI